MDIYERIKSYCALRRMSVRKLEEMCELSYGSISKWRNHDPSYSNLKKVAEALNTSPDTILYEESHTSDEPVQTFADENGYYTDRETAELAQRLFKDPKYRVLFDAADGAPAEDLQVAADMLRRFKEARGE